MNRLNTTTLALVLVALASRCMARAYKGEEGDDSDMVESAFKGDRGQKYGAVFCVDSSSSVLCDASRERRR